MSIITKLTLGQRNRCLWLLFYLKMMVQKHYMKLFMKFQYYTNRKKHVKNHKKYVAQQRIYAIAEF